MPIVIALIRGINVGGHKKIKMADLRQLFTSLGLRQVRTVLQSGNAVFATDESDLPRLQKQLEAAIRERFGFEAGVLLRAAENFKAALARHPFTAAQLERGNHSMIAFLSAAPDPAAVEALREGNPGRESIHVAGNALFIFYTDGVARSKLDNKRIERALSLLSTARNWNTCNRLLKLLDELESQAN